MRFPQIFRPQPRPMPVSQEKVKAIQPGEYLPWKGFLFQIINVTDKGFTAELAGVTKKLKPFVKKEDR